MRRAWLIICAAVALMAPAPTRAQTAAPYDIGAGLEGISDWSRSNAFADLVKQARRFGVPDAPWSDPVPLDANGWPTTDFGVILMVGVGNLPGYGGTYRISFECATTPTIQTIASPGEIKNLQRNPATGVVTADLNFPEYGDQLMLKFLNTQGGVRNLKVLRPTPSTGLFTNAFLEHVQRFSMLRFMDWTATNWNPVATWAQRTKLTDARFAVETGVPWEACIDLANLVDRDVWVNVPHKADDDYVRQLARLLRDRLEPELDIVVEYSNEVWNWQFEQAQWNLQQARAEVNAGESNLNYDGSTNDGEWAARRIARRAKEISDIFRQEFGNAGFRLRVKPVLATQVAWPGLWLHEGLNFIHRVYGPPSRFFAACAGAPYFNLRGADSATNLTSTQVLDALDASVEALNGDATLEMNIGLATWFQLPYYAYECGPDTFGPNNIAAKREASLDMRMKSTCERYLQVMFSNGFSKAMWFVAGATDYNTPYGTWGLTDHMGRLNAPKIQAMDVIRSAAPTELTIGTAVPGDVDARKHLFRGSNWQQEPYLRYLNGGSTYDYLVRVPDAGRYRIQVRYASETAGKIGFGVNGWRVGGLLMTSTGGRETWADSMVVYAKLRAGLNVIRLSIDSNRAYNIQSIKVSL